MSFSKSFDIVIIKRNSYKIILYNNPFNTYFIMTLKSNPNITVSNCFDFIKIGIENKYVNCNLEHNLLEKEDVLLLLTPTNKNIEQVFDNYYEKLKQKADNFKVQYKNYLKELEKVDKGE